MVTKNNLPVLAPADRQELRAWLMAHHATSPGVHLAIGKKGATVTALTYDDAVEEGLSFGWIDSTTHALDADRYTVLFTPRKPFSTWAASNKRRVARLTAQGLMEPAGLAAVETAKANGAWNLLDEIDALLMPPDLTAALALQPGAAEAFAALPVSKARMTLYWIASAKRPATRAKRVSETVLAIIEGRDPGTPSDPG